MNATIRWAAAALAFLLAPSAATAQSAMCADPQDFCSRQLPASCLQRLGAGSLASDDPECGERLGLYRECLDLVAAQCGGPAPAAGARTGGAEPDQAAMMAVWAEIKDSDSPAALEAFANAYPTSPLAALARERAQRLKSAAAGAPEAKTEPKEAPLQAAPPPAASAPRSLQEGVAELQRLGTESDRCSEKARAAVGDARIDALLLTGIDDPKIARKTAEPRMIDSTLKPVLVERRNGGAACNAAFLEDVADLSFTLAAATLGYMQAEDDATAAFLRGDISIGAANARALAAAKTLQGELALYLLTASTRGAWERGGAPEKEAATRALGEWSAAQQRLKAAAPAARVFRCDWRGARLSCG